MSHRLNIRQKGQHALKTLYGIGAHLKNSPVEKKLQDLVNISVSQINGCAYCLDMHYKEARANGETERRLHGLNVWRYFRDYSEKERTAMLWAEAVTGCNVSDAVYKEVAELFSEEEWIDLTLAVAAINTWDCINIALQERPDSK